MKIDIPSLGTMPLFKDLDADELKVLLDALRARPIAVGKGEFLFREGEATSRCCLVLTGSVHLVRYDSEGRESILETATAGQPVGAAFVCAGIESYRVNAIAAENASVLLLDAKRLLDPTVTGSTVHAILLARLLKMMATKNIAFQRKLTCLSEKKTSGKILAFLRQIHPGRDNGVFEIPYTRQELADYLGVARPALSVEITALVRKGIIETSGRAFRFGKT